MRSPEVKGVKVRNKYQVIVGKTPPTMSKLFDAFRLVDSLDPLKSPGFMSIPQKTMLFPLVQTGLS